MQAHLYGIRGANMDGIAPALAERLRIAWTERDSSYRGRYLHYRVPDREELFLQENWDPLEGEPMEPGFREYGLLLYVSSDRVDEVRRLIEGAQMPVDFLRASHS
jgi:hypothetical protein